ncbi:MAG: hypothetical protein OHK0029_15690 [Armatimonadaceae bacterium]
MVGHSRTLFPLLIPPSPALMTQLYLRFEELRASRQLGCGTSFAQFFEVWASGRRCPNHPFLDDGLLPGVPVESSALSERPRKKLRGIIRTMVLLVDFEDAPHEAHHSPFFYERLLFGEAGAFPTGSMREYFRSVSGFGAAAHGVDIQGQVHGWFRLPHPLSYYANQHSGTSLEAPRNTQGMARDAVLTALSQGVRFAGFDSLGTGSITALMIVHAGRGAEITGKSGDLWSLKWAIPGGIPVGAGGPALRAETFAAVAADSPMGVFAHEWGHLAAQWGDYYDRNQGLSAHSAGLGDYCLMASGAWSNSAATPVYPNSMLRVFHDWVAPIRVEETTAGIRLRPVTEGGQPLIIRNPNRMSEHQYVLVEYRQRSGQDAFLPDEGIAVYTVDEAAATDGEQPQLPIELIQADGRGDLAHTYGKGNRGDSSDLYPFGTRRSLGRTTRPALNLPRTNRWSGISLRVRGKPGAPKMVVDVSITP